jgi:hypothetical protein
MPKKEPLYPHRPKRESRDIKPGDLVKSTVWMESGGYPWLTVIGGPYPTSWMGKPMNEYKVTNGLTENNIFEDTIFDQRYSQAQRELTQKEMVIYNDGKYKVKLSANGAYTMWEYEPSDGKWYAAATGDNKFMMELAEDYNLPELLDVLRGW